jgi:D,D-heptose 1,7-bisphosphate phosphatase
MALSAVFLDKDGTLIENVPYNVDLSQIRLAPDAVPALRRLVRVGFAIVLVSNQSGVARGLFDVPGVEMVNQYLRGLLESQDVPLLAAYYCPHHPEGNVEGFAVACDCRKPSPGMLFQAAREHAIHLESSFMVGDILDDVEAGHAAGCSAVLIDAGSETEWLTGPRRHPDFIAGGLDEAATFILTKHAAVQGGASVH